MKMMLNASELGQFTGTANWFRHPLVRSVAYTDGVQYVAEHGGAYWLIDEVACGQLDPTIRAEEFQAWKLRKVGTGAILTVEDGNYNVVFQKDITFTDFPLSEIDLWFTGGVIMLPSEY